jgi:hypothetical protein
LRSRKRIRKRNPALKMRGFNGAVTLRSRKRPAAPEGSGAGIRFNGAVTLRSRKRDTRVGQVSMIRVELQWGRDLAVTETPGLLDQAPLAGLASMGP